MATSQGATPAHSHFPQRFHGFLPLCPGSVLAAHPFALNKCLLGLAQLGGRFLSGRQTSDSKGVT